MTDRRQAGRRREGRDGAATGTGPRRHGRLCRQHSPAPGTDAAGGRSLGEEARKGQKRVWEGSGGVGDARSSQARTHAGKRQAGGCAAGSGAGCACLRAWQGGGRVHVGSGRSSRIRRQGLRGSQTLQAPCPGWENRETPVRHVQGRCQGRGRQPPTGRSGREEECHAAWGREGVCVNY